ncbi:hypothetical protein [Actinomadura violacea]|uniref:Uncharacterized protein n=1 Tax=Actinomadura violacea TaxID=2819934 RepID=A0ABS3RND6_9ACTN|nr:hypothetical protein [Actinomadura violacea]MBO2458177.1 hypothetical protein [Actinomadura violacea]
MIVAVRTIGEAREYVRVQLADCADLEIVLGTGYLDPQNRDVTVYLSRCRPDSEQRIWEFLVADSATDGYGPGTSEAIDGGQWLMLYSGQEQQLAAWADQMFSPALRPVAEGEDYLRLLGHAEGSLTELRKLLVERRGAAGSVWTEQGRAVLAQQPAAFDPAWIDARIGELRTVTERLVARYRDAERRGLI